MEHSKVYPFDKDELITLHAEIAQTIWHTSRNDEGTISATGANIVADALIAGPLAWLLAERDAARMQVAAVTALADEWEAAPDDEDGPDCDESMACSICVKAEQGQRIMRLLIDPTMVLARRDAEVAARTLREAAEVANSEWLSLKPDGWGSGRDAPTVNFAVSALDWLNDRADRIARDGGGEG